MQQFSDKELFENAFGEWLQEHGVELGAIVEDKLFEATIDINELKLAIYELAESWSNEDE